MMLYPSIDKLVERVPSTYSLIILASKRAHEMQAHKKYQLDDYQSVKPVGQALEEVVADKLEIVDK
ncbi:DNA-directed RNA polymerase subunit omega [Eremococcus coleocola]|uniref:DNA-directed RNA polymerase subunit omega n=1 Tax=Eremococcus coleocola ACS-139-V-Col8 TaxID=908337 RepID=E4KNY3_9LACT|nr:DNA-directed RNA polymerase subunit omega [Eremococcus coleocola]EFR31243.1 DNA-directed RNA polymerase, omega subunit [Eremococcus coleocola ACS-139-V-Col8]